MSEPAVALVRCASYDRAEVEDALGRALDLLGGPDALLPQTETVLVKPNLLAPRGRETRVCTDPEVVRAAVTALSGRARHVVVGDSPGVGSAAFAARMSGYNAALKGTGASVVSLSEGEVRDGLSMKRIEIASDAAHAGFLMNVSKLKTHGMMGLTLATKNLFGCVPGRGKQGWHMRAGDDRERFARIVVEIAAAARAGLHVMDAVIGMEGNGPGSGTPRQVGALLVSTDATALDRVAVELVGFDPASVPTLQAAADLGWGEASFRRIELVGDELASLRVRRYRPASRTVPILRSLPLPRAITRALSRWLFPWPAFDAALCRNCNLCVEACPAGCLSRGEDMPRFDRDRCIRCFTCQEVCPHGAIVPRRRLR